MGVPACVGTSRRLSPLGTGLPLIEWHFYDIV